jgi:predicted phage tail protein
MRRYLPYSGVVWGAAIILHAAINGFAFSGNGSYRAGSFLAFLLGVAMVLAGGHELTKTKRRRNSTDSAN